MEKILKYHMLTHFFLRFQLLDRLNLKKNIFLWGWSPQKKPSWWQIRKIRKFPKQPPIWPPQHFSKSPKTPLFQKKNADRGRWFKFSGQGGRAIFTKIYLSFDSMISRGSRPYHRLRAESECILSSSDYFSEHFSFLQENPKNQK